VTIQARRCGTRVCAWSQVAALAGGTPLFALVPLITVVTVVQDGRLASRVT
jgi:hypothetical protein